MWPVAIMFVISVGVAGTALAVAKRKREACAGCGGALVHGRDFAWRCAKCKTRYVREHGQLVQRDA